MKKLKITLKLLLLTWTKKVVQYDIMDALKIEKEGEVRVVRGRVKWFNNEKGYGFIEYTDKDDIFVHYSAIKQEGFKTLTERQIEKFKLFEKGKGFQALNVVVVEKEVTTTK